MEMVRLGATGLMVSRTGFGALPIQRVDFETARGILRRAFEGGINFFDTARGYTDSEEKIGYGLAEVRDEIVIATKTGARDRAGVRRDVEISLRKLQTDYVDILQWHNPGELGDPGDGESAYAGLMEVKQKGWVRHVGITNHRLAVAREAAASGLFATLQYPLSAISSAEDLALIQAGKDKQMGVIAMKALSGGLITNARAAFAFLRQYENVVPIWGIQRVSELEEFLRLEEEPPGLDEELRRVIEEDRRELAGDFCRGCGYCLPCPAGIPIPMAARMAMLMRRAPTVGLLSQESRAGMRRIENCTECGKCRERCPYGLDAPRLLRQMYADYQTFLD